MEEMETAQQDSDSQVLTDESMHARFLDKELHSAIQNKLRNLISKPISPRSLMEIEKTARLAREFLAIGKDPASVMRSKLCYSPDMDDYESSGDVSYNAPIFKGQNSETFGATVIRELLSMKGKDESSPTEIIKAIALAKKKKLPELAAKLEEQLLGPPSPKVLGSQS
jgi:hypothetical protein